MIKNRILKICILIGICIIGLYVMKLGWECPFKKVLHLACPGCGLTRAFQALFELNILAAIRYNILAIPLLIFLIISVIFLIIEIITNKNIYFKELFRQIYINTDFIILILLITVVINNINAI